MQKENEASAIKLAEYIQGLSYDKIPDSAKSDCKKLLLDTLGVMLRGSRTEHGRIAADFARDFSDRKETSVIGYDFKTSSLNAAFANGVMAHSIDYDDMYTPGMIHVSCVIVPTALAMGEAERISGKDLLTAMVGGFDVSCRVGCSVAPYHHTPLGHHATGTVNCFGAAAVAGKILNLDTGKQASAFGLAGTQAGALRQYHIDGSMMKHFDAGNASQNGIFAALLAQRGFTGSPQILEGKYGFCRVLSPDHFNLAELTRGLGEDFRVSQISIKPFPSCALTHTPIEAAMKIRSRNHFDLADIKKLVLHVYDLAASGVDKPNPSTGLQALLSLQYCVADVLVRGTVSVDDFWDSKRLGDEAVREVMRKVEIVEDPELTRMCRETNQRANPIRLDIVMNNGQLITERVDYPIGSPERMFSAKQILDKFRDLASSVLNEAKVAKLIDAVDKLEEIKNVGTLVELLY
jgi:2-methylcitrate dehydratase PrpD